MDLVYELGDTWRHLDLTGGLYHATLNKYWNDYINKKIRPLKDNASLVYFGSFRESYGQELLSEEHFSVDLDVLNFVEPDFMIFTSNKFKTNSKQTRVAGRPNLIAEIWSETNTAAHRLFKRRLYSSSPITEHWYIEQDSNIVERFLGETPLEAQTLIKPLQTIDGLVLDLTYLAL